jgi:hypothetical protein
VPFDVTHAQSDGFFPRRGLPGRAFQHSEVEPGGEDCDRRPDANDEYDANWLRARCSVTVAEFSAVLSLALVTHDFARFADELEQAVQLLKGTATFSTVEAGLAIEIKFTTAGHAEVFGSARSQMSMEPDVSALSFSFETDQSFLAHTVRDLKAIVSRFPVRRS